LFGNMRDGGKLKIDVVNDELALESLVTENETI